MASFDDKHHLAMLALPILLSMLLGFSGSFMEEFFSLSDDMEFRKENSSEYEDNSDMNKRGLARHALEEKDFDAFLRAMSGTPFAEVITQEAFVSLVKEYQLRKRFI